MAAMATTRTAPLIKCEPDRKPGQHDHHAGIVDKSFHNRPERDADSRRVTLHGHRHRHVQGRVEHPEHTAAQQRDGSYEKISTLSLGTHSLSAIYNGDANDLGSTSSAITQTVAAIQSSYSLNPSSASVAAGASTGSVIVTAPSGCTWTVSNNSPATITNVNPTSGSGNGAVNYSVAANPKIVENVIYNIGVTLAWNIAMMTATLPLLGHFLAGAPFGALISDVTPLGAGLGFGSTLAGASAPVGGIGGATLAGIGAPPARSAVGTGRMVGCRPTATLTGKHGAAQLKKARTCEIQGGIMPGMASAGGKSGYGMAGPRYGVKPKVMPSRCSSNDEQGGDAACLR